MLLKRFYYVAVTELLYSWTFSKYSFITDSSSKSILTDCAFLTFMMLLCIHKMEQLS